jgi:hypothetical protein
VAVEAGVEAERLGGVTAFLGTSRDADDAQSLQAGDLADHAADSPGGGADDQGLAGLRPTDVTQPRPGGQAGHPEDAEPGLDRRLGGLEPAAGRGIDDRVVAPGVVDEDNVPFREAGVAGEKDTGDCLGRGRVAQRGRCGIGPGIGHPSAHVGVEREPFHLEKHLAGAGVWERKFRDAEVFWSGWSDGALDKLDDAGGLGHGALLRGRSCVPGGGLGSRPSGHARQGAP